MKKLLIFLLGFLVISCNKYSFNEEDMVKANSEKIFGVSFPSEQDWVMTTKMSQNITVGDYSKVLVLCSSDSVLKVLTSTDKDGVIYFDVPNTYDNLYLAYVNKKGEYFYKKLDATTKTRRASSIVDLPEDNLSISGTVESFASKRGWLPGEVFYLFDYRTLSSSDYDSDFKNLFKDIIFNYFPNGKKYNNLPKIKKSGYYNESSYPITTGKEPIIISPMYKNDGGYHEISEAELYYYYFKGDLSASEIEALPKYRAIDLSEVYGNNDNNVIAKNKSYALVYWNNGVGTYKFPEGYKIGFMYKSNTTTDNKRKQGELYGDGRLNYNINSYGNFASSKLDPTEPRMAWMSINERMFLCIESGTDADFNDLIVEVEGGIKPIIIIPDEPEHQFYTFCFEDQRLGDYDLNDVVLKGTRINETQVEWVLMATGAIDDLYIYNVEGKHINKNNEVHGIFGKPKGTFINTLKGDNVSFVKDTVTVDKSFSFLDASTQPYIYDASKGWEVKIARTGDSPYAIMIPYDFKWPLERICIKDAYDDFSNWGAKLIDETDWYKFPNEDKIY